MLGGYLGAGMVMKSGAKIVRPSIFTCTISAPAENHHIGTEFSGSFPMEKAGKPRPYSSYSAF